MTSLRGTIKFRDNFLIKLFGMYWLEAALAVISRLHKISEPAWQTDPEHCHGGEPNDPERLCRPGGWHGHGHLVFGVWGPANSALLARCLYHSGGIFLLVMSLDAGLALIRDGVYSGDVLLSGWLVFLPELPQMVVDLCRF